MALAFYGYAYILYRPPSSSRFLLSPVYSYTGMVSPGVFDVPKILTISASYVK